VKTHALCMLCRWGFREGLVDRIREVPVRARKNYFSSIDSKKINPVRILARGLGVCVKQSLSTFKRKSVGISTTISVNF
jgi:hypothetical protein